MDRSEEAAKLRQWGSGLVGGEKTDSGFCVCVCVYFAEPHKQFYSRISRFKQVTKQDDIRSCISLKHQQHCLLSRFAQC